MLPAKNRLLGAAIIEDSTFSDSIRLFVSISSPWGGEGQAKTGVEKSPAVIPSWKDVEPDSPYIQRIFSKKLDPSIRPAQKFLPRCRWYWRRPERTEKKSS